MSDEVVIICSTADPASLNIYQHLLELVSWGDHGLYKSWGLYRLVIHTESQISLLGLDRRLADIGLDPKLVVFACRHQSNSRVPWLGGHFTGEILNGKRELSAASPSGLRSFLHNVSVEVPRGFRISAEATHHGPADMTIPCFFAEIGSSDQQWSDPQAGEAVAKAVLALETPELPVFLGFGGGHYMQRQTNLMFEAKIAFGHLFSSYQMEALDLELVKEAQKKSNASYAYIDRKSLQSEDKKRISTILEDLTIHQLRSKEIRARFPSEQG